MKTIFGFLAIVAALLVGLLFVPLATAIDVLQMRKFGFEAAQVEGNLWEGRIYDASLAKVKLGDVMTRLSFEDLTKGRLRLNMEGSDEVSRLKGVFSFGWGGLGIDDFNIGLPMMAGPPPIGSVTLIVDGLKASFPGGECQDGRGEVRAYLSGALPSEMSGPALCRDGNLAFDLASPSGREREEVTILAPNKYRVKLFIKPVSPRVEQVIRAKGFVPTGDGYAYEEERTI